MLITREQLIKAVPGALPKSIDKFILPLNHVMEKYDIDTPHRIAAFISQLAHESNNLNKLVENLNYTIDQLMKVFPRHFKTRDLAVKYAHRPIAIANRVYANRYGNRDEASGDGWHWRGRGLMHHTFKDNYVWMTKDLDYDYVSHPDDLFLPEHAAAGAGWFWDVRKLNPIADKKTLTAYVQLTVKINGGTNGMDLRVKHWEQAKRALHLL